MTSTSPDEDPSVSPRSEKRSPGPRRRLSQERIVDGAIRVIEAEGLSALSMRRLAEELRVVPGTLYTYVENRTALETLVLDTVVERDGLPHQRPGIWRAQLEAGAWADWHLYKARPWILDLHKAAREVGPNMIRWIDSALRVFDGLGLTEHTKLHMINTLDAYIRGAATVHQETLHAEAPPPSSRSGEVATAFAEAHALQRALGDSARPFGDDRFAFGLRCLLDGFEQTVASVTPKS